MSDNGHMFDKEDLENGVRAPLSPNTTGGHNGMNGHNGHNSIGSLGSTADASARAKMVNEISFIDVCYTIDTPNIAGRGKKSGKVAERPPKMVILDKVSGQAKRGEMMALMGPSGSGKTSLLNVLSQRVPSSTLSGGVFVDGKPITKKFKRRMGFVFQDDLMLWNLTVYETILFAAKLKLPQSLSDAVKHERTMELLKVLGLAEVAHQVIGKEGRRGVSGGERKRASIGVELVTTPSVLFLDEPTSGLDSTTALGVIELLSRLAKQGMVVICSIHQPRSNIFSLFDTVMLLQKGKTVYYGAQSGTVPYFERLGLSIPPFTNPADWVLDLTSNKEITLADGSSLTQAYSKMVDSMDDNRRFSYGLPTDKSIRDAGLVAKDKETGNSWVTGWWYQLSVLLERQSKQSRGEVFNGVNIFQIMAVACIASAVWWQSTNVPDITGVFFFILIQQGFNALNAIMRVFPAERGLMMRERSTGSYRVGPYFMAKCMSDLTLYLVFPIFYAILVYWSVGLRTDAAHFVLFIFIFVTNIMTAQSLGMLISAAIKDPATAQSFSFVLVLVEMLFGGFYVNASRLPQGILWIRYLSFMYWAYAAMIVNEYGHGRELGCEYVDGEFITSCPTSGEFVVDSFGFGSVHVWVCLIVLWTMFFVFRYATYLLLRFTTKLRA